MNIPYTVQRRPDTGVSNVMMGVWLFLASEVMLFGALFIVGGRSGHAQVEGV